MKKKTPKQKPIVLKAGYFMQESYDGYKALTETASDNWHHHCTYQLLPHALQGEHRFLHLHTMQLSYAKRPGGMMNNTYSASDCISIAVMQQVKDKACFDKMKLKRDDILFFDDSSAFNFMSNDAISFAIVSVQKSLLGEYASQILAACNHRVKDTQQKFSKLLEQIWEDISQGKPHESFESLEAQILSHIKELLDTQALIPSKLTQGEEISLQIRDQVYTHMDGKISISSLAQQYNVSDKTLQNSFKSLFGFTPKLFLRQLKLNLVHYELSNHTPREVTVSNIARKWGFAHMGRFSRYYTDLFCENPSITLKRSIVAEEKGIGSHCARRKEEIE
ncbi:MAG TPA: AraC family transcriptional regulator [Epsilonproteobacteria bacterium]|nr:AraC family transcriptional regulator [Campylobacterota bacterium]